MIPRWLKLVTMKKVAKVSKWPINPHWTYSKQRHKISCLVDKSDVLCVEIPNNYITLNKRHINFVSHHLYAVLRWLASKNSSFDILYKISRPSHADFAHLEALDLAVDVQEIQQRRKNRLRFLSRVFRDSFRLKHLPAEKILLLRQGGDKFRLVHIKKPKEPPPPPPPIAQVLKPIVPPKPGLKSAQAASEEEEEFSEFSSDEFDSSVDLKSDGEEVDDDVESGISSEDSSPDSNKSANSSTDNDNNHLHRNVIVLKNTPVIDVNDENRHRILISSSSSSWIKVETPPEKEENRVKAPPRLKKLAKLRKLQVLHEEEENMRKIYHRPEISSPVLLATTFNPNDAEAHKSIQTTSSSSSSSSSASSGRRQNSSPSSKIKFGIGDKIQRLSSLLPSLSSLSSLSSKEMGRSSFYVAEAVYEEAMAEAEDESSPLSSSPDHIYEEIPEKRLLENRPLPPIPQQEQKRKGSIFEGASKYEILHYLKDAKNRFGYNDFEIDLNGIEKGGSSADERVFRRMGSGISSCSSSSSASSSSSCEFFPAKVKKSLSSHNINVERADSGVGSETSYNSNSAQLLVKSRTTPDFERKCVDCRQWLESNVGRLCKLCEKRRIERKEIVTEIYETELKYGRDLRIIVEEFYRPMLVAGLLTSDQLAAIFLNAEELIRANALFSSLLGDSINAAVESGDPDLVSVRAGKIFLDAMFMLRAYESYCTRQVCMLVTCGWLKMELFFRQGKNSYLMSFAGFSVGFAHLFGKGKRTSKDFLEGFADGKLYLEKDELGIFSNGKKMSNIRRKYALHAKEVWWKERKNFSPRWVNIKYFSRIDLSKWKKEKMKTFFSSLLLPPLELAFFKVSIERTNGLKVNQGSFFPSFYP